MKKSENITDELVAFNQKTGKTTELKEENNKRAEIEKQNNLDEQCESYFFETGKLLADRRYE